MAEPSTFYLEIITPERQFYIGTPAAVGAGFVEIKPDYVILLVGFAEHPEEIDRKRAEAAKQRAEERLRQKQSIHEYYHSKAALARAMARLKTKHE